MIARLTGKILELKPTELILDVHGIGYKLSIPFSTYEKIKAESDLTLYVFTLHKEDQFRLFGFYTEPEKEIFSILINISGIGPAMALSLLSGITIDDLIEAVQNNNIALLTKVPGIGKSKAEKFIFELKRKIKKLESFSTNPSEKSSSLKNQAVEALASLGFNEIESYKVVDEILSQDSDLSLEKIIKEALRLLS
jgi:Holliday junction DNA helicase RuvA